MSLLEAALQHARNKWPVFPLLPGGKAPHGLLAPHGLKDATTDLTTIYKWWKQEPDANIGVATGHVFDVLDIDDPDALEHLPDELNQLGPIVMTPRGLHVYVRPTGLRNTVNLIDGVDWRGPGGYVVAPPSVSADGGRYEWDTPKGTQPGAAPEWLLDLFEATEEVTRTSGTVTDTSGHYGRAALNGAAGSVLRAVEGTRNHTLNTEAFRMGQLVGGGEVAYEDAHDSLVRAAVASGLSEKEAERTVESGLEKGFAAPRVAPVQQRHNTMTYTKASTIPIQAVKWVWEERIPLGELALLAGREGVGKSTAAYTMAAQLTQGTLPGEFDGTPKSVLVCATEDSWGHTIVPRLLAAGADLERVFRVDAVSPEGFDNQLSLPGDLDALERDIPDLDAGLLLLDPLLSRLDASLDTHKDAGVRQALEPLVRLAHRTHVSVVGIIHVNKSNGTDPGNLLMGSRAFPAVARSVLFCMADPDEVNGGSTTYGLMGVVKCNLAAPAPTLMYQINSLEVGTDAEGTPISTGALEWTGETDRTIAEALAIAAAAEKGDVEGAIAWLGDFLLKAGGGADRDYVKRNGADAGYSMKTLAKAAGRMGITMYRPGPGPQRDWVLPAGFTRS